MSSLLLQGCLSRKRVIPQDQRLLPAQNMSRADLLKKLDERSRATQKMSATVVLDAAGGALKTGVLTEYRQTRGFLLVERPSRIRVIVQAPLALATIADMVSDGRQYKVSVPIKNKFMVGNADAPPTSDNLLSNLRPNHIMDALFINTVPYQNNAQVRAVLEETTLGQRSFYVVEFVNISAASPELLEKVWVDRTDLEIARKQIFKPEGKLEMDVEYSQYQVIDNMPFPLAINIQRPLEDYSLKITFDPQKTTLNGTLAADAFQLAQPSGAELVQLNPR